MTQVLDISWRDLPGNKYLCSLDASMASEAGYLKMQRVCKKGERPGKMCNVHYDREYLIQILSKKVIQPLGILGKERVIELVSSAWDSYVEHPLTNLSQNAENN